MFPSFSSTTSMLLCCKRHNSRRSEVANPDKARAVVTSGLVNGADNDEDIEG